MWIMRRMVSVWTRNEERLKYSPLFVQNVLLKVSRISCTYLLVTVIFCACKQGQFHRTYRDDSGKETHNYLADESSPHPGSPVLYTPLSNLYIAFDLPSKVCAAVEEERRRTHGITGSLCKSHTRAQLNSNGQLMHVKWRIYMDPTIQMWRPRAIEEWMDSRTLMFEGRRIPTFAPWNWVRFPWWLVGSIVSTLVLSTAFYGKSIEMGEVRGWTTAVNDGHEISGNWSVILPLPRA